MAASLEIRLTGGAGNSDPNASLGGVMSSTALSGTPMNNLFDNVDPDEAVAGDIEYRAVDIYNTGDAPATSVKVYTVDTTSPDTEVNIGPDAGTQSIVDESTAPDDPSISFGHHDSANKLSLSDIDDGAAQRLWIKRTVTALAGNMSNDLFTLKVEYA